MTETAQSGDATADRISSQKETYTTSQAGDPSSKWLAEIRASKQREEKWRKKALDILARFRNERGLEIHSNKPTDKKTNILWSNTEVLMSHLCTDLGTPDVRRMFPQPGKKTKVARLAAEVLEKTMVCEGHAFDVTAEFESAIEDSLLPGRGQVWIDLEEGEGIENKDADDSNPMWLEAKINHVDWEQYLEGPSRRWDQVPWVGRMHLFEKEDLEREFPEYADQIPLNYELDNTNEQTKESLVGAGRETISRAPVWEIWCKTTKERIYVAEDYPKILKVDADPYRLKDFFPGPPPLYAIKTTNTRIPVPLFIQYQDQADELDRLTTRRYRLVETAKYCGLYGAVGETDDTMQDLSRLEDGEFIPFKGFAVLQQAGGLASAFLTRDLGPIMAAIQGVENAKSEVVQTIYEITGISDIIRGSSDANETYGAQKLKARFGSNRSSRRQRVVQRFVRDAYRLKAEVIAEHYPRDQLAEMTGIPMPTTQEQDQAKRAIQEYQMGVQRMQQMQHPQLPPPGGMPPQPGMMPQHPALPAQQQNPVSPTGPMGIPPQHPPMGAGQPMPGQPPQPGAMPQGAPQTGAQPAMAQPAPSMPPIDPESMAHIQEVLSAVPWEDISGVLRSNARRLFMVDVETDDTAFDDEESTKENALEFMKALFDVLGQILPACQANPMLFPLAKEIIMFVVDAFKVGQVFEDTLNDTFEKLQKMPPPQQGANDPKAAAAQASAQLDAAKTQNEQQRIQNTAAEAQQNAQEFQLKMQTAAQEARQKQELHQADMQSEQMNAQREAQKDAIAMQKLQLDVQKTHEQIAAQQAKRAMMPPQIPPVPGVF